MATALRPTALRDTVSPEEWALRVDLAAAYRLVALYGWDDLIFTHLSARVPGPEHHFLINPYSMMFEEITASSLVKIDVDGNTVSNTTAPVNRAGFVIHSAIHAAREDARKAMGDRFDVRDYHDLVLASGPVPMSVLQAATKAWTEGAG